MRTRDKAVAAASQRQMAKPRILFVTQSSPFESSSGTHQRSHLLFRALQKIADVDVVVVEPARALEVTRADRGFVRVVIAATRERHDRARFRPNRRLTHAVEQSLQASMGDYAMVVGRFMWGASQLAVPAPVPIVLDLDDFRYRYSRAAGITPPVLIERARKYLSARLTRRELGRFRAAFFSSPLDHAEAAIDGMLLRNIPLLTAPRPNFESSGQRLLFVGSLWYRPNREGVDWFLRRVWPAVVKARPAATVKLVGAAAPSVRARWLRHPNVEAPGFVDDLADEYANATLVIVPIHSGGGSNIKLLEALAHGRACVATKFGLTPYRDVLGDGLGIAAADDAPTFASHCLALLDDAQRRSTLARKGHTVVTSTFTVDGFDGVVASMVRGVLS